ncbi:MAG: HNH endonuclease [Nanoarchaeota archaeon]
MNNSNKRKLVLEWDFDKSFQDGYLHTRSFPLSLGKEKEFSEIKRERKPVLFILEQFEPKVILAQPRQRYPGELNSLTRKSSKFSNNFEFENRDRFFYDAEFIGFSHLYKKLLGAVDDSDRTNIKIRQGVKIELYSTERKNMYVMEVKDKGLRKWRSYRKLINNPLDKNKNDRLERAKISNALRYTKSEIRERANKNYQNPVRLKVTSKQYQRNPWVAAYALKRANGYCELCNSEAPFQNDKNEKFLEVHHLFPLAQGGKDTIINVAALCPNCHRRLHYGIDRHRYLKILQKQISITE